MDASNTTPRHGTGADLVAGALAGLAAVWAMDRLDWFQYRRVDPVARTRTRRVRPGGEDPAHVSARGIERAFGLQPSPQAHHATGQAIHYAFGVAPAAAYAVLRRHWPAIGAGRGALFGLGLFLLKDEGLNAATGLSAPPRAYPWQAHARGLVSHLAYGMVVEAALRMRDRSRASDAGMVPLPSF